ncbi:hypothetical protein H6770_03370 [Candidatus Peribacteria bacterium]|nr:hypothetical protein [Candidatus Peribacteria bacterium]
MATEKKPPLEDDLASIIHMLNDNVQYLASLQETARFLWVAFLRGIMYGLGIIVAFAIVVPIILWLLSTINWIPFIGDIVTEIITRIEATRTGAGF